MLKKKRGNRGKKRWAYLAPSQPLEIRLVYPAINTVLTEWPEGLKHLLGKKIVGPNLSGSLAYGVFVPERHDIDSQAVVRTPVVRQNCWSVRPRVVTIYNPLGNPLILKSLVILAKDSLEE